MRERERLARRRRKKKKHPLPPSPSFLLFSIPLTSSPEADVVTKLVALDSQETTALVGVAVAVSCTGPPRVVTVGLAGVRLVEPKHEPATHSWPTLQAFPHTPQLRTSVVVSTQEVEHSVGVETGQVHTPDIQDWLNEGHTVEQLPQWSTSFAKFTQDAPHTLGVRAGQVQVPDKHVWLGEGHAAEQAPQLEMSVARFTQAAPQRSGESKGQRHVPASQD